MIELPIEREHCYRVCYVVLVDGCARGIVCSSLPVDGVLGEAEFLVDVSELYLGCPDTRF